MYGGLTLPIKIGQRVAVGFDGYEIPDELRAYVKSHHLGNFILFSRNIRDSAQLRALCDNLQALAISANGVPAFISVDQEGGTVARLPEDATVLPGAMCVGASPDPEDAFRVGQIMGRELRALGINLNHAPCADVNSNPANPVIGVRSFGDSPETVGRLAARMIRGMAESGVLSCAKHFPGHGDTSEDSHLSLPCVEKSLQELEACELVPFAAAIGAGVPTMMTAHIRFPQIEPEAIPATMSRRIITGLLKQKMGYTGLVLSDCMMMKAIADHYGTVEGTVAALAAGVDMVYICHDAKLAAKACDAAAEALAAGRLSAAEMEQSAAKILAYKQNLPPAGTEISAVGCDAHRQTAREIAGRGLTLLRPPSGTCPPLGDSPLFLGCAPFRVSLASDPENRSVSFPYVMREALGGEAVIISPELGAEEIAGIVRQAAGHSAVVVGTFNGYMRTGQLALVRALAALSMPVVCVALCSPYDLSDLPDHVTGIAVFAYNSLGMSTAAACLAGTQKPVGRLPVRAVF
jgi:beta-N-acetylhexosaminidase